MEPKRLSKLLFRRRLRPWFLGALVVFIIVQVVALSPSSVEESAATAAGAIDPESIITDATEGVTLAQGIPKNRISDYSVDRFQYVSSQGAERQWKIDADRAFLYNAEKLVHARRVKAFLYDPEGKITVVTGLEAKYFMNKRDLEVYGHVKTLFPDGFELDSEYLHYRPVERRITIPTTYRVKGDGHESKQNIKFDSDGLDFEMARSTILLPQAVRLMMDRAQKVEPKSNTDTPGVPDRTTILSDRCVIHRDTQIANFTMSAKRPLDKRFVHIIQPDLFVRGRRADLHYGDFSQVLQYMSAFEDVLIKETGVKASLRYGTGGRADFDSRRDVVILTEYPQVYQDNDTVTGDIITVHRDTDMVEVEHSNAFSQGN